MLLSAPAQGKDSSPIHGSSTRRGRHRCGHDGQRKCVAHMPTAATTTEDSRSKFGRKLPTRLHDEALFLILDGLGQRSCRRVCHLRRIARVTVKSIAYALAATLLATSAHAEDWQGNFRRCDVTKSFSQGKVRISVGEMIELDILWNDGADLDVVTAADIS